MPGTLGVHATKTIMAVYAKSATRDHDVAEPVQELQPKACVHLRWHLLGVTSLSEQRAPRQEETCTESR
jgi:hypothetical protein